MNRSELEALNLPIFQGEKVQEGHRYRIVAPGMTEYATGTGKTTGLAMHSAEILLDGTGETVYVPVAWLEEIPA